MVEDFFDEEDLKGWDEEIPKERLTRMGTVVIGEREANYFREFSKKSGENLSRLIENVLKKYIAEQEQVIVQK